MNNTKTCSANNDCIKDAIAPSLINEPTKIQHKQVNRSTRWENLLRRTSNKLGLSYAIRQK